MVNVFLSDAWFDESDKIAESFGKIDLPEKLVGFILNLTVTGCPGGDKPIHFTEGRFGKGHHKNANTMLTLPYELCYKALLQNDTKEAMKGFLTRKIRVKGDMTKMLTLASIKSEGNLESLRLKTLEMTEPLT
jgi:putative sterol carrier protein